MNKLTVGILIVTTTTLLAACGGGSGEDNKHSSSNTSSTTTSTNSTPTTNSHPSSSNTVGQHFTWGKKGRLSNNQIAGKTYYARFAYCQLPTNCRVIKNGVMHFNIVDNAGQLSVQNLVIDAAGVLRVSYDGNNINYEPLQAGVVDLADSKLTVQDEENRIYQLTLKPTSTYAQIPNVNLKIAVSASGKEIISGDEDYLFVAQQLNKAPVNWTQTVNKSGLSGSWKAVTIERNGIIKAFSQVLIDRSEVGYGASKFSMTQNGQTYWGVYKNSGYGYAFGYTRGELTPSFNNYDGISGVMITSPDNSFGVGYDDTEDGGTFLLTK